MAEAVAEEYKSSLSDLNFNSKPHINMLTMLAEDNIKYAPQIVQAIADHIQTVPSEIKLPGLYLVDSIIKNVGKQYLTLFSQNLVTLFSCVFEKVEENTRSLLYKLRQTWNDILPNKILYAVDVRVKKLDPAWPVTAQAPAQSIHINPKFLGSNTQNAADMSAVKTEDQIAKKGEVLKQLVAKQKQLEAKQEELRILTQKKKQLDSREMTFDQKIANLKPSIIDPRTIARINQKLAHRDPRLQKITEKIVAPRICEVSPVIMSAKYPVSSTIGQSVTVVPKSTEISTEPIINNLNNVKNSVSVESVVMNPVKNSEPSLKPSISSPKKVLSKRNDEQSLSNSVEKPKVDAHKSPNKKEDSSSKVQAEDAVVSTETEKLPKQSKNSKERSPRYSRSPEGKSKSSHYSRNQSKTDSSKKSFRLRSRSPIRKPEKYKSKNDTQSDKDKQSKKTSEKGQDHPEKGPKSSETSLRDQVVRGKNKRESSSIEDSKENSSAPPDKKVKADLPDDDSKNQDSPKLFGKEDQDYRQLSKSQSGGNPKGWAQYKESHPDEYKSPLRPARNNMESAESFPEKMKNRQFPNVGPNDGFYPPEYDRLGRPRLHRGRDQRFPGHRGFYPRGRGGRFDSSFHPGEQFKDPLASMMLTDPGHILQQAEAKFRLGRISENEYLDLKRDLSVMMNSDEFRSIRDKALRMQEPERFRMHGNHPGNEKPFDSGPFYQGEPLKIQGPRMPPPEIRSFKLDSKMRTIHFVDEKALVIMDNDEPRELSFKGEPRLVFIEGLTDGIPLGFEGESVEFHLDGKRHNMRFGAPSREVYIDNHPYEAKFGGPPFAAMLEEGRIYKIRLGGPPPQVVVGDQPQFELFAKFRGHGVPPQQPLEKDYAMDPQRRHGEPTGGLPYDVDMRVNDDKGRKPDGYDVMSDDMKDVDWRHCPPTNSSDEAKYFQPEQWDPNMPAPMNRNFHEQNPQGWKSSSNFPPDKPPLMSHDWETLKPPPFPRLNGSPHNTPPRDKEWEHQQPYDSPDRMDWRANDYPHDASAPPALLPHPDSRHLYENRRHSPLSMEEDPSRYHDGPRDSMRPNIPPSLRPQFDDRPQMRPRAPAPQFGTWQRPNFRERGPSTSTGPNLLPPPLPPFQTKPSLLGDGPKPLLEPPPAFPDLGPVAPETISERVMRATAAPVTVNSSGVLTSQANTPSSQSAPVEATASSAPINIDVGTLFQKLIAAGIINSESKEADSVKEKEKDNKDKKKEKDVKNKDKENKEKDNLDEEPIPPIQLKLKSLRQHHNGVISALYRGSQCASCGMRFKEIQSEHYSRHLDWHFRMNRREKDGVKKAFSRRWYYEVEDWNQFEEFEDFEERAPSYFELQTDGTQLPTDEPVDIPSIPALGQETEVCVVCGEPFQLFWVEEEEEWHLRDAVRHESQAYHPACYEDHKKASEVVETPTEEVKVVIKQEPPDDDEQAIADVSDALEDIKVKTEEEVEEAMKVEETDAVKDEAAVVEEKVEDSGVEVEDSKVEFNEEPPEDILEGKPGEEEIIGLISESDMELEDARSEEPKEESKMVVQSGGGIVLKIKAESMQPQSPAGTSDKAEKEESSKAAQDSDEEEFRPPTPDPRFQVLPPVKKGTELSGLCRIM